MASPLDTRCIPCDPCVFRFDANILQVGEFRAGAFGVILEPPQACKRGIGTKRLGYVITETPCFTGALACQILIEVVVSKLIHGSPECLKRRSRIETE